MQRLSNRSNQWPQEIAVGALIFLTATFALTWLIGFFLREGFDQTCLIKATNFYTQRSRGCLLSEGYFLSLLIKSAAVYLAFSIVGHFLRLTWKAASAYLIVSALLHVLFLPLNYVVGPAYTGDLRNDIFLALLMNGVFLLAVDLIPVSLYFLPKRKPAADFG